MRTVLALALLLAFAARYVGAQTMVQKTIAADPVTTYDDGSPLPAGTIVTYDLEHRICGDTAWVVFAAGLATPSSVRQLNAVCHQYAYVAIANGVRSVESDPLTINLTPPKAPAKPQNIRSQ